MVVWARNSDLHLVGSFIFQVLHFPAPRFGPSFSRSCIFQPCDLVLHFPGLAFSSPAIWSVIFQVLHFPALRFGPSFSGPAFSSLWSFLSVIFRSCKFSAPVSIVDSNRSPAYRELKCQYFECRQWSRIIEDSVKPACLSEKLISRHTR